MMNLLIVGVLVSCRPWVISLLFLTTMIFGHPIFFPRPFNISSYFYFYFSSNHIINLTSIISFSLSPSLKYMHIYTCNTNQHHFLIPGFLLDIYFKYLFLEIKCIHLYKMHVKHFPIPKILLDIYFKYLFLENI